MSNVVTQSPPTIGVKDPATREVLDAIVNILDLRSGNTDKNSDQRFLTVGDFKDATNANRTSSPASASNPAADAIQTLRNNIQQELITQILETPLTMIDIGPIQDRINVSLQTAQVGINSVNRALNETTVSLTQQINSAVSRIATAEAAIVSESYTRATADTALTSQFNYAISRIDSSEAAITNEEITRANRDNALAQAVNTIWAAIGNGQAVIQDGVLANITPSAIVAEKWSQVQATLTDPATGLYISSAAIKSDAKLALDKAGNLEGSYTVKIDANGYVTGFGLAVQSNNGAPTSAFQIRADSFSIVSPSGNRAATVMTNNTINVYDENGVSRVTIGRLS